MRNIRYLLPILLSILSLAACDNRSGSSAVEPGKVDSEKSIVIGVIAPLSGAWSAHGQSIEQGAKLAASELNQSGGVLGKQIVLEIADSQGDPELGATIARQLVSEKKAKVLIGTVNEPETLSVIDVATELKTPFIYSGNGVLKTCRKGSPAELSPVVWSSGLTDSMVIEPFLIHLSETLKAGESALRFLYLATDSDSSAALISLVKKTVEGLAFESSESFFIDPRVNDFYQRIESLFRFGAEVLFVDIEQKNIFTFMEQALKLSVRKDMAIVGLTSFPEENLKLMAETGFGVRTVTSYSSAIDSPANRRFLESWTKTYPNSKPTALAASGGYGSVKLAALALTKAKESSVTAFAQAMNGLELEFPQGRVFMDAKSHVLTQPVFAVEFEEGGLLIKEFLGEISHSGVEDCHPMLVNPPKTKKTSNSINRMTETNSDREAAGN